MRAGIENWFLRHWYDTQLPPWYLRMLEPVYRSAYQYTQKRGKAPSARYRSAVPLIVVGNITAGGSGKTPLVIRLCQLALDMNIKVGIASTGYARQSTDTFVVNSESDTLLCGDEPVLLAKRTGVPVVVAARRRDAIRKLNEMDLDLVFSDDGLQQADLDRDIEICVVDGLRGLGNGHLLPAGPLRESAARLRRVDYVITNGIWGEKPDDLQVTEMKLEAGRVCALDGTGNISVDEFRQNYNGERVHAVAGIGHPQRFFRTLETLGISAKSHAFPDHHLFTDKDFESITSDSAIIMTEKDAVKCHSLGLDNAWYLPVNTLLPGEFEVVFKQRLVSLMKERK